MCKGVLMFRSWTTVLLCMEISEPNWGNIVMNGFLTLRQALHNIWSIQKTTTAHTSNFRHLLHLLSSLKCKNRRLSSCRPEWMAGGLYSACGITGWTSLLNSPNRLETWKRLQSSLQDEIKLWCLGKVSDNPAVMEIYPFCLSTLEFAFSVRCLEGHNLILIQLFSQLGITSWQPVSDIQTCSGVFSASWWSLPC